MRASEEIKEEPLEEFPIPADPLTDPLLDPIKNEEITFTPFTITPQDVKQPRKRLPVQIKGEEPGDLLEEISTPVPRSRAAKKKSENEESKKKAVDKTAATVVKPPLKKKLVQEKLPQQKKRKERSPPQKKSKERLPPQKKKKVVPKEVKSNKECEPGNSRPRNDAGEDSGTESLDDNHLDEMDPGSDTEFIPMEMDDVAHDHGVMYTSILHVARHVWDRADQQLGDDEYALLEKNFNEDDEMETPMLPPDAEPFNWSADFTKFTGVREKFNGSAGPQKTFESPYASFVAIWDLNTVTKIARETNRYAHHRVSRSKNPTKQWKVTDANEIYLLLGLFMFTLWRKDCDIFFKDGLFNLPMLKNVMTFKRFISLIKLMHFVDNSTLSKLKGEELKLAKLNPIAKHCSKMFESLYLPYQNIAIDDSIPLYTGENMEDYMSTKSTGIGKRIYECSDALTGYVWRFLLHTGRIVNPEPGADKLSYGAGIIMQLTEGIHDRGHTLLIDNCLNSPALARSLKRRGMDVVGTVHACRRCVPQDIKDLDAAREEYSKGHRVSRHSGDVSLNSLMNVSHSRYYNDTNKLTTVLSTFHDDSSAPAGTKFPAAHRFYDESFHSIGRRDNRMVPLDSRIENDINTKWYMQAFTRILTVSIWNSFILYTATKGGGKSMSYSSFKQALSDSIMKIHVSDTVMAATRNKIRLSEGPHYPYPIETLRDKGTVNPDPQWRCARCKLRGKLSSVEFACLHCEAGLCMGTCFEEYHTLEDLSDI